VNPGRLPVAMPSQTGRSTVLGSIAVDDCFDPGQWRDFVVIAEIVPDGDVVPVRADYAPENGNIDITRSTQTGRSGTHCQT
jgi:hypothetical protein